MRNSLITAMRTAILLLVSLSMMCWAIPLRRIAEGKLIETGRHSAKPPSAGEDQQSRVPAQLKHMPLQFIENRGQVDPSVDYYVKGRDTSLYFGTQGVSFALQEKATPQSLSQVRQSSPENLISPLTLSPSVDPSRTWSLDLEFVDANPRVKPKGHQATPTVINYFTGKRDHWRTGLSTYGKVVYENLWPGIDLIYSGDSDRLKYTFVVKPGADPNQIRLAYRGASAVRLNDKGQLEVTTPVANFNDDNPYSYQENSSGRTEVATAFALESKGDTYRYGFSVGAYDRAKPLLIDPAIMVYAGYLGGNHEERALGIAVDNAGNAYVTGESMSTSASFPATPGSFTTPGGGQDAFVAKLNAAGTAFIYCAYIGGSGDDVGFGIATDSSGNAYVAGATSSTEATFPVNVGPDLTHNGGGFDAFVAKIDPTGTSLVYCGYIGGAGADGAGGLALDIAGNAYVTGGTNSTEESFPVSVGPDLTFNGGLFFGDAFVAKVNDTGNGLAYCGFIGGTAEDAATGVAVDANGNAYVTGGTNSTEASFPVKVGPDLTYNGGLRDGWVAKVNTGGSSLAYCGFIGGNGADLSYDIAVDNAGSAYVTGETSSTEASFPVRGGPDLTYNGGSFDAFVARVNAAGSDLAYAGYIGGSGRDWAAGIAIDGAGNAYVAGSSHSSESSFPAHGGPDQTFNGGPFYGDAFVAKIIPTGSSLLYCSYIGGDNDDVGYGIAVDSDGNAYVAGETSSTEATFPVTVGPDLVYNGGFRDGFMAKISTNSPPDCSQAIPSVARLWPANHAMVSVSILGVADPDGDPVTVQIDRIMQDEPTNGTGDGDTCPDAQGVGTATAKLRAERSGNGNGRVYTIFFSAIDGRGGSCQGSVKVCVPHHSNSSCTEDLPTVDSLVCAHAHQ